MGRGEGKLSQNVFGRTGDYHFDPHWICFIDPSWHLLSCDIVPDGSHSHHREKKYYGWPLTQFYPDHGKIVEYVWIARSHVGHYDVHELCLSTPSNGIHISD